MDLGAAGGNGGGVVSVQVEQLGRIVIPITDCFGDVNGMILKMRIKNKDAGGFLPSQPPKPLLSDHWKLSPLMEYPALPPLPALITIGSQAKEKENIRLVQTEM